MTNKKLGIFAIVLVSLVAFGGLLSAYGRGIDNPERGLYHEQMEEIIEEGNYEDLVNFRNEIGYDVARRVVDEESFQQLKERHTYMEENGIEPGQGQRLKDGSGNKMGQRMGQENYNQMGECPYQ